MSDGDKISLFLINRIYSANKNVKLNMQMTCLILGLTLTFSFLTDVFQPYSIANASQCLGWFNKAQSFKNCISSDIADPRPCLSLYPSEDANL